VNSAANQHVAFYDVVVIGGALSGASTATLLLRQNSGLCVLIVGKSAQLTSIARAEGRLVATEYRASHCRRLVAVERRERLG